MLFYFLDVVDAGVSGSFDWAVIIVLGLTILVETMVMLLMKYNRFGKALLDSFLVNLASIGVGFVLIQFKREWFNSIRLPNLLLLLAITILVEWGLLFLLNRKYTAAKSLKVCAIMNVVTYFLFFLFVLTQ